MPVVKELSHRRLQNYVLPRRKIDEETEKFNEGNLPDRFYYRRVTPDEEERGELYPVWEAGIQTFAHFGIGVGIYFFQLLLLTGVYFISGMIMIAAVYAYSHNGYGVDSEQPLLTVSAACQAAVNVTATMNCPHGASECLAEYRENCNLPGSAAFADLFMSLLFMIFIYVAKSMELKIEEDLDEAIQTAQDYSLEVTDPNEDADNPDEWFKFFSTFGTVRYITLLRRNNELSKLLVEKHKLHRKSDELKEHINIFKGKPKGCFETIFGSELEKAEKQLIKTEQQIAIHEVDVKKIVEDKHHHYPICRVYVTFEQEEAQRKCVSELEVPDIDAIFDSETTGSGKKLLRFRGINTLNVVEPPEPDNIIWKNMEVTNEQRRLYSGIALAITLGLLVASYFIIDASSKVSSITLSIVIGFLDSLLPNIFEILTNMTRPKSEGRRQSDLQSKLFLARLLISTIFPYIQTSWHEFLSTSVLQQIINVQITACFTTTLLDLLDINGLITRHIIGPMNSETQAELNLHYSGMDWSLAAKYTGIAKILFLSLFYAILTPICLLIAMIAFGLLFLVDRYQLLRRWKPASMLDASIATRLRQQAILAVTAHMFITLRFIYSWPMDQVYIDKETQQFAYVDKYPSWNVFKYRHQEWHTEGQRYMLRPYKAGLIIVASILFYIWVLTPLLKAYGRLFHRQVKIVGQAQGKNFTEASATKKMSCYVPLVGGKNEKFLLFHNIGVRSQNMPALLKTSKEDKSDLSDLIKPEDQHRVLSTVKYYGEDIEQPLTDLKKGDKVSTPPSPSPETPQPAAPTGDHSMPPVAVSPIPRAVIPPLQYSQKPEKKPTPSKQKRAVQNDYASLPKESPMKLPPLAEQQQKGPAEIMSNLDELYNAKKKSRFIKKGNTSPRGDIFHPQKKVHPALEANSEAGEIHEEVPVHTGKKVHPTEEKVKEMDLISREETESKISEEKMSHK